MDVNGQALFRHMVRARAVSNRMVDLQRAGRIGFHSASVGEEAVIIGAAAAAGPADWIFPGMREWAAALVRGLPIATYVHHAFGSKLDPALGHSPPDHAPAKEFHIVPPSGLVGAHLVQAVGMAWAARTQKKTDRAIVLFGEDAAESGDFHNAMNFAGVWKTPVVFVARAKVADRAVAYGMASAIVDGDDVEAVFDVVSRALESRVPTLIEAITKKRDPLAGLEIAPSLQASIDAELDAAIAAAEAAGPPAKSTMFDHVYAQLPAHLQAQKQALS